MFRGRKRRIRSSFLQNINLVPRDHEDDLNDEVRHGKRGTVSIEDVNLVENDEVHQQQQLEQHQQLRHQHQLGQQRQQQENHHLLQHHQNTEQLPSSPGSVRDGGPVIEDDIGISENDDDDYSFDDPILDLLRSDDEEMHDEQYEENPLEPHDRQGHQENEEVFTPPVPEVHVQQRNPPVPEVNQEILIGPEIVEEEEEDYFTILENMSRQWILSEVDHTVSQSATNSFWDVAFSFIPKLLEAKKLQKVTRKVPKFNHIRRQLYKNKTPEVRMEIAYRNKETDEITIVEDTSTPASKFSPAVYEKLYEKAYVKVITSLLHIS